MRDYVKLRREDWEKIQGYLKGVEVKLAQPPDRISKIRIRDYAILRLSILRIVQEALAIKPVEEECCACKDGVRGKDCADYHTPVKDGVEERKYPCAKCGVLRTKEEGDDFYRKR